jgi:ketosteroid isomerase-like protein
MLPRRSYLSTLSCVLIALCFLMSACASKQQGVITEQKVSAFLAEMDKAAMNKDVEAIIAGMSEDVRLKVTIEGFGPTQILTFNRDEYRDHSMRSMAFVGDYKYRRGETIIKVEPDGQTAYVADETFETMTIGGQTVGTVARGTSTLKLENGKLVITRSEATARPFSPEGKTRPTRF